MSEVYGEVYGNGKLWWWVPRHCSGQRWGAVPIEERRFVCPDCGAVYLRPRPMSLDRQA